jgi:L-aspartate-L-methionine ligase
MTATLQPVLTMADVYGPGHVYAPRAHPQTADWIRYAPPVLDALTGNQLSIIGHMDAICSAGSVTPRGLELLAEAGLPPASSIHTFRGEQGAIEIAAGFAERGVKIVVQHRYPDGVLRDGAPWIAPPLLSYLNNKANLAEIAPRENVAPRRVTTRAAVFDNGSAPPLPIVLKVATDLSTGGGTDVVICRTSDDVAIARERFVSSERLVVESYQSLRRNVCVHYSVMPDGTVRYLGFAEQDVDAHGLYCGNWISLGAALPGNAIDIGLAITTRAASLGYRGLLGIDIAETNEARWIVLDLNFRLNGSTAAVLLAPAIQRAVGPKCLHLRRFVCEAGFLALVAAARSALRSGTLIPLGIFDAEAAGYAGQPSRLSALVVANSQADAHGIEKELAASGLA